MSKRRAAVVDLRDQQEDFDMIKDRIAVRGTATRSAPAA